MSNDKELLELAAIGRLAITERSMWLDRNAKRNSLRKWMREYQDETGEYFTPHENPDGESVEEHFHLTNLVKLSQSKLATARSATRRAILRAAASIREVK